MLTYRRAKHVLELKMPERVVSVKEIGGKE
jgi:hypothetical protein